MIVFVGSTYEDLKNYRSIVEASLYKSGYEFNGMEHFGADSKPPLNVCLDAVSRSDVYIGILGMKYGSSPPQNKMSYCEREYLLARTLRKPIYFFLIDESKAKIAPKDFEKDPEKLNRLEKFKERVLQRYNVGWFTTEDNLAWQVLASLRVAEIRMREDGKARI